MARLELGVRVKVGNISEEEIAKWGYTDPEGLVGTVVGYDPTDEYPWYVDLDKPEEDPETSFAINYPELYAAGELTVLD